MWPFNFKKSALSQQRSASIITYPCEGKLVEFGQFPGFPFMVAIEVNGQIIRFFGNSMEADIANIGAMPGDILRIDKERQEILAMPNSAMFQNVFRVSLVSMQMPLPDAPEKSDASESKSEEARLPEPFAKVDEAARETEQEGEPEPEEEEEEKTDDKPVKPSAPICFGKPTDVVCIACGIASALAVQTATRLPCLAVRSATDIESVEIPESVTAVLVFADTNPEWHRGAEALRLRLESKNLAVALYDIPEDAQCVTWGEVLRRHGVDGFPIHA